MLVLVGVTIWSWTPRPRCATVTRLSIVAAPILSTALEGMVVYPLASDGPFGSAAGFSLEAVSTVNSRSSSATPAASVCAGTLLEWIGERVGGFDNFELEGERECVRLAGR